MCNPSFFFFRGCCSACKISSQYKNRKHTIPLQNWNMVLISFKYCSVTKSSNSSKCPPCIWFLTKKGMLTIPGKMVLSTQSTSFKKPSKWLLDGLKCSLSRTFPTVLGSLKAENVSHLIEGNSWLIFSCVSLNCHVIKPHVG